MGGFIELIRDRVVASQWGPPKFHHQVGRYLGDRAQKTQSSVPEA